MGPLSGPRALQGTCPTTLLPDLRLLLVDPCTGAGVQPPRQVPRPSRGDAGLVLSLAGGCSALDAPWDSSPSKTGLQNSVCKRVSVGGTRGSTLQGPLGGLGRTPKQHRQP